MHYEMTIADLEAETAVALPDRQLMALFNWAGINATSTALALNASSVFASANAFSGQSINVVQL
jgi:hypothetical protein